MKGKDSEIANSKMSLLINGYYYICVTKEEMLALYTLNHR